MENKVKIGIIGLGTIGYGVCKNLLKDTQFMSKKFGFEYELAKVADIDLSKAEGLGLSEDKLTKDAFDIINDDEINIVCELIGGIDLALKFTLEALKAGKIVISANKALLCAHGDEIFKVARENSTAYFFEASVAGGIPIIKVLREGLVANKFSLIYGILNGTCNYILTRMENENAAYESILEDAKSLGYVEANESLDIDGWDTAHKTSILAYLAHGEWFDPKKMLVEGIRRVRLEDMLWAKDLGYRIKLIGCIRKVSEGSISVAVYPALIALDDVVANVNEVFNAVSVTGDIVGTTVHIGKGAGQDPTSSAVIADISDAIKSLLGAPILGQVEYDGKIEQAKLSEIYGEFYLRIEVKNQAGVLAKVASIFADEAISIDSLEQKKSACEDKAVLFMTVNKTTEEAIEKAKQNLVKLDSVLEDPFILRIFKK